MITPPFSATGLQIETAELSTESQQLASDDVKAPCAYYILRLCIPRHYNPCLTLSSWWLLALNSLRAVFGISLLKVDENG